MIRINLLKPEKKELEEAPAVSPPKLKKARKTPTYGIILIILVIAVFLLFFFQRRSMTRERNLLRGAQEERKQLEDVLVKLEKLEGQKSLLEKKINLISQLKSFQEAAVRIMDELSTNIPDWVWLTETNYSDDSVEIKGNALSNNLIADYILNLENSPYFSNVNLISSTQKKTRSNQYLEFSLTAQYVLPYKASSQEESEDKK